MVSIAIAIAVAYSSLCKLLFSLLGNEGLSIYGFELGSHVGVIPTWVDAGQIAILLYHYDETTFDYGDAPLHVHQRLL